MNSRKDINTVFELEQAALIEEGDVYVPSHSYVRLKHLCSDTWLHSTNLAIDREKEFGFTYFVNFPVLRKISIFYDAVF